MVTGRLRYRDAARPPGQERQASYATDPRRRTAGAAQAPARYHWPYIFTSERGAPFTPEALNRHIKRLAAKTSIGFPVHVHMLRHACGFKLANDGHDTRAIQDWLGHRAIQHTVRYTELSPTRFKDFWKN
jgi:site-specific recombinase XerD